MTTTDQRKLQKPGIDIDIDRLSSLPEDVLAHILSSLPTKYAVGTAVLSRRWKNLWTKVSNLDLYYSLLNQPPDFHYKLLKIHYYTKGKAPANAYHAKQTRDLAFSRFMDRILSQLPNLNSLRRFRLRFSVDYC
ncbi:unnamed protein product [Linum trigynum]|uniref:F-box domain-containing protein n=1 Tax=Linum trigynum TaxID=586398 RepID=A0AAV2FEC9_9ROSI